MQKRRKELLRGRFVLFLSGIPHIDRAVDAALAVALRVSADNVCHFIPAHTEIYLIRPFQRIGERFGTGADASRSALVLVCAAPSQHNLRLARGRSFTQRENASRSDAPRSAGTIASSLIFPLRFLSVISGWLLKQKHPTDVGCFCFGNRRRHTLPGTCPRHTLCFSSPLATECRARSPARNVFLFAS